MMGKTGGFCAKSGENHGGEECVRGPTGFTAAFTECRVLPTFTAPA